MSQPSQPGALVVSLDFELHWGMRDHVHKGDQAFSELSTSREVVTDLCTLFERRGIRSTWATVGFLFAATQRELVAHSPSTRPSYQVTALDPYLESIGVDEEADPEHFAWSLVEQVASTPGQEVASHTFSHYYCLEPGQTEEAFRADLAAAQSIAQSRGLPLTSLVFPRNQWNPGYADALIDNGFNCYRGPQPSWGYGARRGDEQSAVTRLVRLADTYAGFSPPPTMSWGEVRQPNGLSNVPASAFLRPYDPGRRFAEPLRRARLIAGLRQAARRHRIFHLWWHPHNFAGHPRENFDLLNSVLDEFDRLAATEGMQSMSMCDVAERAASTRS